MYLANLKRYSFDTDAINEDDDVFESRDGEWVKFADLDAALPSASNNSRYATALDVIREMKECTATIRVYLVDFENWCRQRLNA